MIKNVDVVNEAQRSLDRLLPRLEQEFSSENRAEWQEFTQRLIAEFPRLFELLLELYGDRYDFFYHLERILALAARAWFDRPREMKKLDEQRRATPNWFQSNRMLGAVCYVDRFAGNLQGLREKLPYLQELGVTYLHLMPLFKSPEAENDGGYAISDYRQVDPRLGTMEMLKNLADELRQAGISLVLDFVFNHTSDEHIWAQKAVAGDPDYRDFYYIFPDRTLPDAFSQHLREIFPDEHPGCFTYRDDVQGWVWTTFHSYQWDLNYRNPAVFRAMAGEMLFLANMGAEVLRFDALAFIWKQMNTSCENLPQAHTLIQAFNAVARLAAPSLLFKSEAIVHPDEVIKYVDRNECQLSYNPLLMALIWNSLATRKGQLLRHSLSYRFSIPEGCAWVNYVRCHDDIGWTFDDGDAAALGINGFDHRQFLNAFYMGRFEGSFARGLPFQENQRTGDARISGTLASLAGLEEALQAGDSLKVTLAIRRILLAHAIILGIGGIPLLYLGDELGMMNDYSYRQDPAKAGDSRWVHRPIFDWQKAEQRHDATTVEGQIYQGLHRMIRVRKENTLFSGNRTDVLNVGNDHVFAYLHTHAGERMVALHNLTEQVQIVSANELRLHGLSYRFRDLIQDLELDLGKELLLEPYQVLWLVPEGM